MFASLLILNFNTSKNLNILRQIDVFKCLINLLKNLFRFYNRPAKVTEYLNQTNYKEKNYKIWFTFIRFKCQNNFCGCKHNMIIQNPQFIYHKNEKIYSIKLDFSENQWTRDLNQSLLIPVHLKSDFP